MNIFNYDIIVVGGGHAGIEAVIAASKMNMSVLLLTNSVNSIGDLACNPSIGGIGKSHLVKELDSLGGGMALFADKSGISYKILNSSRGFAVQSTRVQVDRFLYKKSVIHFLLKLKNLNILQQSVVDIIIKNDKIIGVKTNQNFNFFSNAVIFTVGTFLGGKIFIGKWNKFGGRIDESESSSNLLSHKFREIFSVISRLKTGTPPRIDIRSINLKFLGIQKSDIPIPYLSSFYIYKSKKKLRDCYISYTNDSTHDVILNSIHLSSVYNGNLNVSGPRYCPSIEDKVVKFNNKFSHHIYLEPEGLNNFEFYLNGLSTSLPLDIQYKFLKTIKGFENIIITRPGYAVEYDYFDPRILNSNFETKSIKGLFFAGQINGTTGYEEAAVQGFFAGVNASCFVLNKENFYLPRSYSYIGVLIDDLIMKGVDEPYRMFTSRSENRLFLREDNADYRLIERAKKNGLISNFQWDFYLKKLENLKKISNFFNGVKFFYFYKLLRYFSFYFFGFFKYDKLFNNQKFNFKIFKFFLNCKISFEYLKMLEIKFKYVNYINKYYNQFKNINKYKSLNIPKNINYFNIKGLSNETSEKLNLIRPLNVHQIFRIPGLNISSIFILINYIRCNFDIK